MDYIQANTYDTQYDHIIRMKCSMIVFAPFKLINTYVSIEGRHETFNFWHHLINSHISVFVPTYRSLRGYESVSFL
jgi:hypothetical protein